VIPWAHEKRKNDEQEIRKIESQVYRIHQYTNAGFSLASSRYNIKSLETRWRKFIANQEASWRLKSQAICLDKGDENTKFFQDYAKGCKTSNTIWKLKDREGPEVSPFEGLAQMGKNHFQTLFKSEARPNIIDIVLLALFLPIFMDEEGNKDLFFEVSEAELK